MRMVWCKKGVRIVWVHPSYINVHVHPQKICKQTESQQGNGKNIRQQSNFFSKITQTLISTDTLWSKVVLECIQTYKTERFWSWNKIRNKKKCSGMKRDRGLQCTFVTVHDFVTVWYVYSTFFLQPKRYTCFRLITLPNVNCAITPVHPYASTLGYLKLGEKSESDAYIELCTQHVHQPTCEKWGNWLSQFNRPVCFKFTLQ